MIYQQLPHASVMSDPVVVDLVGIDHDRVISTAHTTPLRVPLRPLGLSPGGGDHHLPLIAIARGRLLSLGEEKGNPGGVAEGFQSPPPQSELPQWAIEKGRRGWRWVTLTETPASIGAISLTDAVTRRLLAIDVTKRPGPGRAATVKAQVGAILSDVIKARHKDRVMSAHRSSKGGAWRDHPVIGHHAFWQRCNAMQALGLVETLNGLQTNAWAVDDPCFQGLPTRIWATDKLMALAAQHGVTEATTKTDWVISKATESKLIKIAPIDTVRFKNWLTPSTFMPVPWRESSEFAHHHDQLTAFNAFAATHLVTGCRPPCFRRTFLGSCCLGGRVFAVGQGNFQTMAEVRRLEAIKINNEAVAEVDLKAAHLSIFLGLSGRQTLPSDPYDLDGLPRAAVKQFFLQTMGGGKPAGRWSPRVGSDVKQTKIKSVRDSALKHYPELASMTSILPQGLLRALPEDRQGWAVGQYLVNVEAKIIVEAMSSLRCRGVLTMPMHDALIVPRSRVLDAEAALREACRSHVGLELQLETETSSGKSIQNCQTPEILTMPPRSPLSPCVP